LLERKKVLILCESMGGGVRRHLMDILDNINLNKYHVLIIYGGNRVDGIFSSMKDEYKTKGIDFCVINELQRELNPIKDFKSILKITGIIKQFNPDIIHCHSSKGGGLGRIAGVVCGVNSIIYTPHGYSIQAPYLGKLKKNIYLYLEKLLSKVTSLTINVSQGERKIGVDAGITKKEKTKVIYNGIQEDSVDRKKESSSPIIVGTVARFDPSKDPYTFYNIALGLIEKHSNIEFWYIGDGDSTKSEIEHLLNNRSLQDKIKLFGFKEDIYPYLSSFDIYISTSLHEGLPYSIVEAMSLKLPIVGTNVTGNNELIINKYNGMLFEKRNVEEAIEELERLILNENTRKEYGENSYKWYKKDFTIEKMITSIEQVYDEF